MKLRDTLHQSDPYKQRKQDVLYTLKLTLHWDIRLLRVFAAWIIGKCRDGTTILQVSALALK